jgi:RNA polymerase sigma factor (sigma-70 family)
MMEFRKPLPAAEQVALCRLAQSGDTAARDRLVTTSMGLVGSRAHRFRSSGVELEDLVSEGTIGLFQAIKKFDPDRGTAFTTYAVNWIDNAIRTAILDWNEVKRGDSTRTKVVREVERRLAAGDGLDAAVAGAAQAYNVLPKTARALFDTLTRPKAVSLDVPTFEDGRPLVECMAAVGDDAVTRIERAERETEIARVIHAFRATCSPRERVILDRRILAHEDDVERLHELGESLDLSKERVRQLETRLLDRLRYGVVRNPALREVFGRQNSQHSAYKLT